MSGDYACSASWINTKLKKRQCYTAFCDLFYNYDFSKGVGATGHSFGGNAAYVLCARNPEFVCGINIDSALFGDYSNDTQTRPFMQISCQNNEKAAARVYLKHTQSVYKVLFKDMKHIGFSDSKFTIPMKSVTGKLEANLMHKNLCKCHLEFFDAYLKKINFIIQSL
jgi:hypothetical protein